MTITSQDPSLLKNVLNAANTNELASLLQAMRLGDFIRAMPVQLTSQTPAVNSYNLATVQCITLPEDAKAAFVLAAFAHVGGGGTPGFLVCDPPSTSPGTAPATGHCGVTPNGDIAFLGTDGYDKIDVLYIPLKYDVVELTLTPAAGVATLPAAVAASAMKLLEAEVLAGSVTGKKIVLTEAAAGLPATTKAQLLIGRASVNFNNATDAPTSVRVKLAVSPGVVKGVNLSALLTAVAPFA